MGRLLLLSMFFVASSIQAQDCVEPVAGKTSQIYICENADPFDLQPFMAPTTDGRVSEPGGYFVIGSRGTEPALHSEGTLFDPAYDAAGTYYYRVDSKVSGCNLYDTAAMAVYFAPAPDPGISGTAEILSTAGKTDLFQFLEGNPDEGGTWSTADGVTFDPAVDESGTYWYTAIKTTLIDGPGDNTWVERTCTTTTTSVTVTKIEASNDGKVVLCHNGKPLSVNIDALPAHEAHGDQIGDCGLGTASKTVVSPNPSRGEFNFFNDLAEIKKVRILNFQGGLEKEFKNSEDLNRLEIDLGQLRKGIYFAEVFTANGKEVIKLVKK